jgi:hypothetical protein
MHRHGTRQVIALTKERMALEKASVDPHPLIPALSKAVQRRGKPIRVVFVCESDMGNSTIHLEWFKHFLESHHVPNVRKLFSFGTDCADLHKSRHKLSGIDYFVAVLPQVSATHGAKLAWVPAAPLWACTTSGKNPVKVIDIDGRVTRGKYGELLYHDLLAEIIKLEEAKQAAAK